MKISLNLLRTLIDTDWTAEKIADRLTMSGSEVEAIENKGGEIEKIIVAKVVSKAGVKGSEKLSLCQVDTGHEKLQVVCGAPNVAEGQTVLFAPVGSSLPGMRIDNAIIHGIESYGMIVSEAELGFSVEADVIAVLPSDVRPGTRLEEIVKYKDTVFELEITPNRPDCLSHLGIARELQALGAGRFCRPKIEFKEIAAQARDDVRITVEDPEGCPRYTGRVIRGVKVGPSPLWLKIMVQYLGMRPINNVVDITNFVMLELGHPLHAFDFDLFGRPEVIVRRAADGQKFVTLDNVERKLNKGHLLITDGAAPVAIAGIMGGEHSEVSTQTKRLLLESAYFNPVVIRRGSKALSLSTESSRRFERGADLNMATFANNRACGLISDICGGEVLKGIVDTYPKPFVPVQIELRPAKVELLLGKQIEVAEISGLLSALEIDHTLDGGITVRQPSFRPDLTREVDLIEEIARIHGFENLPASFEPGGALVTPMTKLERIREKVRAYLTGAGASEIFPITLGDFKVAEKLGIADQTVRLMNPLSEEMGVARPNLLLTLLPIIRRDFGFRETDLTLFEIGDVYHPEGKGRLPLQETHLAIALTGMELPVFWGARWRERDLFSLKGMIEDLADHLQAGKITLKPTPFFAFDKDYSFEVYFDTKMLGFMGRLSGAVRDIADIKHPVFYAELNFEELVGIIPDTITAKELARFPSADRDMAIVVDEAVTARDIQEEIFRKGSDLVDNAWIFDLYRGKNIPAGKKSLAFGIRYRLANRTLTDEEVNAVHSQIVSALEQRFGAELRK